MAESSNEQFVPEVPENEDFILFAADFVNCVMSQNVPHYNFESCLLQFRDQMHVFDQIFERAVRFLDNIFQMNIDHTFRETRRNEMVSSTTYTTFADSLVLLYFGEGFHSRTFLYFCVRISKMAALYYLHGIVDAPKLAKLYIINILKEHHMTVDIWNKLHRVAMEFDNWSQESDRLPENIDSEEIKLNREHYDVSGHESRISSLSEKQNVVQQEECARSKKRINKYAKHCSENSSEIGVSSLKVPETSSEHSPPTFNLEENGRINGTETKDNLKPGISNIVNDFVDILSICEGIMGISFDKLNDCVHKSLTDTRSSPETSDIYQKSEVICKRDCKRMLDFTLNVKDNKSTEILSFGENKLIDNVSSKDGFQMETSNDYQKSNFTSKKKCKMTVELSPDEKNDANQSTSSGRINFFYKFESNEKLASETPNANQISVSNKRRKLNFTSNEK